VLARLSVWREVQTCTQPSWCHWHSLSLASVKSRLFLPFWYRLTWVVPDKGPLNGRCVCVCVRTFYRCDRSWIVGRGAKGGGMPETSQNSRGRGLQGERDRGSAIANRPPDDRPGNCPPPCWTAGQSVDVAGGWARETVGSAQVSGTMAHMSKHRLGHEGGDVIADRTPVTGNLQACSQTRPDDRQTCQWSFLFPIEADWSSHICTAGMIQWRN